MKVIGVGMGRTGTTSIQRAFQQLGYRAYNFEAVVYSEQFDDWRAIAEGKAPDWDKLFQGYDATISWPACFFYEELAEAYPDAKFILTSRDPERWADSVSRVSKNFGILKTFRFVPRVRSMLNLMETLMFPRLGDLSDKEQLMVRFQQHNEAVRAYFPPERLLVYEVKDGWTPLCDFLGQPVPETEFPYENQGDAFIKSMVARFVSGRPMRVDAVQSET